MFVPLTTIFATIFFCGFLWWVHSDEQSAKKRSETRKLEEERADHQRELKIAQKSVERWRAAAKEAQDEKSNKISN